MSMRQVVFWALILLLAWFVWTRFLRGKMSG